MDLECLRMIVGACEAMDDEDEAADVEDDRADDDAADAAEEDALCTP